MNQLKFGKLFLCLLLVCESAICQIVERHAANVTPTVGFPYSLSLEDYFDPAREQLVANIMFNDFNEPSWTFKLRITIESPDIRLQSRPGFTPSVPVTISPGEMYRLTGIEWQEYFDRNNLILEGPGVQTLNQKGRLPEGAYTITLQVLDYHTGETLSPPSLVSFWMGLFNPPLLISPAADAQVHPSQTQFNFSWQLFNNLSPNALFGTDYQLTIWELTDPMADPMSAVANGQALQVFQSDILNRTTSYPYGLSDPPLESGKAYIYRVRAMDPQGKDVYKNDGYSEFRRFFYGYPTGNVIELVYPDDNGGFRKDVSRTVKWMPIEGRIPNQWVDYHVEIAKKEPGETNAAALGGALSYSEVFSTNRTYTLGIRLDDFEVEKVTSYAWQVIAFSDGIEVGKSKPRTFHGAPLFDNIYAGRHRIAIDFSNGDTTNLSGTGRVRLSTDPSNWTEVRFEGLVVKSFGGYYMITDGEIICDLPSDISIPLDPRESANPKGEFRINRVKLNEAGLSAFGNLRFSMPFPALSDEKAMLVTTGDWVPYDYFDIYGSQQLAPGQQFELLEPYGFQVRYDESSSVSFDNDSYGVALDGRVSLPDDIKDDVTGATATLAFANAERLDYYTVKERSFSALQLMSNASVAIRPNHYVIDLSSTLSPGAFQAEKGWAGVYFEGFAIEIPKIPDEQNQVLFGENYQQQFSSSDAGTEAYVSTAGLTMSGTISFGTDEECSLNQFPASPKTLTMMIRDGQFDPSSVFRGDFRVPLLSKSHRFDFEIGLTDRGFMPAVVTGLEGRQFYHNEGDKEQAVIITVKRAVFEDNVRLSMTVDAEWPALNLNMTGLRNLKAWGDYRVGFYKPEGVFALDNQLSAQLSGYPVTVDAVAVGRSEGTYGFGISGKVVLGEDVSGNQGPPSFNMYSIAENNLLPGDYVPEEKTYDEGPRADPAELVAQIEKEAAALEENLTEDLDRIASGLEEGMESEIMAAAASLGGNQVGVEDMVAIEEEDSGSRISLAEIGDIRDQFVAVISLAEPFAGNVDLSLGRDLLMSMSDDELSDMLSGDAVALEDFAARFASDQVANQMDRISAPLTNRVTKVNNELQSRINEFTNNVNRDIEKVVSNVVDAAASPIIDGISGKVPDAGILLGQLIESTKLSIVREVQAAISYSVYENVNLPIATLLEEGINGRVESYLDQAARDAVMAAFTSGERPTEALANSVKGMDDELARMGDEVLAFLNPASIRDRIKALGEDAIANIDGDRIVNSIQQGAIEVIANYAKQKAGEAIEGVLNDALSSELGIEAPIDIGGAASKLLAGGNFKDVLSDPVKVKVRSKPMDMNGEVFFTEGHPIYGDVWSGAVEVRLKVPKPFNIDAAYMNGRKDGVPFWFAEVGGSAGKVENTENGAPDGTEEMGGSMDEEMESPGIDLGVGKIMALRGRVFTNMRADGLSELVPDPSQKFGAYLHMVLYGPEDGTKLRAEMEAEVNTFATGDLTVSFRGNLQLDNVNPQVMIPDPNASIQGEVEMHYNSAEKHFFGYAGVVLKLDGLCADGSLLVDVKPGLWRVAMGQREQPLGFVPGCVGLAYYGWLDLNQSAAELGVGMGLVIDQRFGNDKLAVVVDAGIAAFVFVNANYKPLRINEVGVFVEMWARLLVAYNFKVKKGTMELLDAYLYAAAIMRFNPNPTILYGDLRGQITILNVINIDFNESFELEV